MATVTPSPLNILILTPQIPYPPRQGASLRNYHIIRGLAERNQVSLLSFREEGQAIDENTLDRLLRHLKRFEHVAVPPRTTGDRLRDMLLSRYPDMGHRLYGPDFEARLVQMLTAERYDVVQIEGIELARALSVVREHSPESLLVFDDHNAEAELQRRTMLTDLQRPLGWPAAFYSAIQVAKLRRFERWACQSADVVTAVSQADADQLRTAAPHIHVIPNCIDVQQYAALPYDPKVTYDLVFTGKMDYRPNVDAMLWFVQCVWPLVKRAIPDTTLAIVGQKPHKRLRKLAELDGVRLTGYVESVDPYIAAAKVFIMPLRMGSGTRLKLLEALAAGKAIVSTRIGAEGFPVEDKKHLLLEDDPEGMAAAILTLLRDPSRQVKLGEAGIQLAQAYDWRVVIPQFEQAYRAGFEGRAAKRPL